MADNKVFIPVWARKFTALNNKSVKIIAQKVYQAR
jgi:hypothetical protein